MAKNIRVEVKTKVEGEAIQRALADPVTRAFVVIVGTLLPFPDRARRRLLGFVADSVTDPWRPVSSKEFADTYGK